MAHNHDHRRNRNHQIPLSSGGCSPKASITTEPPSSLEEGLKPPTSINVHSLSQVPSSSAGDDVSSSSTINAHKIIAELVGSYVVVFVGCGFIMESKSSEMGVVSVGAAWGLAFMVMIYALGHVSGGHFNPAVTVALAASCSFPWKQVAGYVAAQVAGSSLAVLSLSFLFDHRSEVDVKVTVTRLQGSVSCSQGLAWEFVTSFFLMLTICGVAVDPRAIQELSGITIGAAVMFNVMIAGNMTGASMNPARSIGPALVNREFHNLWIYVVGPIVGMLAATAIYTVLLTHNHNHNHSEINSTSAGKETSK
ncbi:unnamed protein product [Linum trigynum]|uniref:Uncharacterized protein n=1 Tax=Linum trigynum TaxID=586398 RepID=A0AAV2FPA7_9ROSI